MSAGACRPGRGRALRLWCFAAALGALCGPAARAFNLDEDELTVYSGPAGSYFGYAVDFHGPDARTVSVLVGAPKANTSQPDIVEGGAVYHCPWPVEGSAQCKQIPFDNTNNRKIRVNGSREPVEFKSRQWFGATLRAHRGAVVACAPLYQWRTLRPTREKDPVGTCFVAIQNFSAFAEYSPCRNSNADPEGQGYCQAGFSLALRKNGDLIVGGPGSFYWQGQVITASIADIIANYSFKDILRKLAREKQTDVAPASYDDSYLGYSVAAGEFTGDFQQELVAGVPRGAQNFGYVSIINSTDMTFIQNFTGEQMASYFGYTVAVSDVNNDGLDDVLVGAPLFMERESPGSAREVGRVYLYAQVSARLFSAPQVLAGSEVFGRFGSAVAPLGDLNRDGYNDIAVGAPFSGQDRRGQVLIYNGNQRGLNAKPSQTLRGAWASEALPSGFGFTLRGDADIDRNDYPDLLVGAFGTGKVVVYRARPVVTVDAQLLLQPSIINLENKTCQMPDSLVPVACFSLQACASVAGQSIPDTTALTAEVHLDSRRPKGAVRRSLFLVSQQPRLVFPLVVKGQRSLHCRQFMVYLRDETEFRDKLSPINIRLNYSLDESTFKGGLAVRPILNHYRESGVSEQAHILVDCGEDNVCVPDLKLSARTDKHQVIIGDENHLTLIINARNDGEGAYEAELFVTVPEEADYVGVQRSSKGLWPLSCEHRADNGTRTVACDLGNPMAAGASYSLGLRFAVPRLEKTNVSIIFDLQIRSEDGIVDPMVPGPDSSPTPPGRLPPLDVMSQVAGRAVISLAWLGLENEATSEQQKRSSRSNVGIPIGQSRQQFCAPANQRHCCSSSRNKRGVPPPQIVLPLRNWRPEEEPRGEEGVGPLVEHVYEVHNAGPSPISEARLEVGWPLSSRQEFLLYVLHIQALGPLRCQTNPDVNPQDIKPAASLEVTPELRAFLRNATIPHLVRRKRAANMEPHRQRPAKVLNCTNIECLHISCVVGRLEGGESAVLKVRSRLWAQTFLQRTNAPYALTSLVSFEVEKMPFGEQLPQLPRGSMAIKTSVIWATPNVSFSVPLWVILLAILFGLLVLAILTLALWKCGFFDRARPPQRTWPKGSS